MLIFQ